MQQPNLINTFLQEADDLLSRIEETVLDIGSGSTGHETINELFRAFHTIKGSAAMFGYDAVSSFTHHVENALDQVRSGQLALSSELLDIVLAARDRIKILLDGGGDDTPQLTAAIVERLAAVCAGTGTVAATPISLATAGPSRLATWRIRFRPDPGLLASGGNPSLLFRELAGMGQCTVVCSTDSVPTLDMIESDKCYLWWTVTLRTDKDENAIRDVFMFVEEGSELLVEQIGLEERPELPPTQELVTPVLSPDTRQEDRSRRSTAREATVRVPSSKLDILVNLVGELVMNQSRLTQAASHCDQPDLAAPVEEIERLVAELRDNVLGIRMMPIGTTFSRFKRLVHDLSAELGKDIELATEGAETELDKTVLDQLGDPLVHLIRNSVDHGIESTDERTQAGKPERGTIRLTAVHTGSNVVVRIQDDGRGLNCSAIRAKAIEKQLIGPDASLSDKEIYNLIFLPGFSTAQQVTSVSGRGVGMDVVRRQIEALSGSIGVTSQPGAGTTISLTLPLTLAIIDGLLVQVAGDQFIVPMSLVTENVELHRSERSRNNGRNVVAVRGELIPYITLRHAFSASGHRPDIEKIVLVRHEDQRVGLVVDRVIGSHQTVIQSLGTFYRHVEAFSGATIMGDGRVALILDVAGLVRSTDRLPNGAATGTDTQEARPTAA